MDGVPMNRSVFSSSSNMGLWNHAQWPSWSYSYWESLDKTFFCLGSKHSSAELAAYWAEGEQVTVKEWVLTQTHQQSDTPMPQNLKQYKTIMLVAQNFGANYEIEESWCRNYIRQDQGWQLVLRFSAIDTIYCNSVYPNMAWSI